MARQPYGIVQQQIERLLQRGSLAGLSEWQLLERYATQRDERAFEALVVRHGPMVLGVCRRVLLNEQAAEDAFQATFLVLIRKAPSLDQGKPLGNWLYTVAFRLALRIRANEARRLRGASCRPPDAVPGSESQRHDPGRPGRRPGGGPPETARKAPRTSGAVLPLEVQDERASGGRPGLPSGVDVGGEAGRGEGAPSYRPGSARAMPFPPPASPPCWPPTGRKPVCRSACSRTPCVRPCGLPAKRPASRAPFPSGRSRWLKGPSGLMLVYKLENRRRRAGWRPRCWGPAPLCC